MRASQGSHPPAARGSIPYLTGLRGLAAAIVFISHAAIAGFLPSPLGHGFGQVGVMIFFVLSGYLMSHLYIKRPFTAANVRSYAAARVGRVVPLYLAVVAVSIVVFNFVWADFRYALDLDEPGVLLRAALFLNAPFELWTIPVEIQFYVTFIAAWWLYGRLGRMAIVLVAVLVTAPALFYMAVYQATPTILPTYGFAFFLGALTADLMPIIQSRLGGRVPSLTGAVFLVLLFLNTPELRERVGLTIVDPSQVFLSTWLDPITWVIVYGLFVSCLLTLPSLRLLDSRPFVQLGNISYGLYLLHYPIIEIVDRTIGNSPLGLITAAVASCGLAWLSYRYFEVPLMKRIRQVASRRDLARS